MGLYYHNLHDKIIISNSTPIQGMFRVLPLRGSKTEVSFDDSPLLKKTYTG